MGQKRSAARRARLPFFPFTRFEGCSDAGNVQRHHGSFGLAGILVNEAGCTAGAGHAIHETGRRESFVLANFLANGIWRRAAAAVTPSPWITVIHVHPCQRDDDGRTEAGHQTTGDIAALSYLGHEKQQHIRAHEKEVRKVKIKAGMGVEEKYREARGGGGGCQSWTILTALSGRVGHDGDQLKTRLRVLTVTHARKGVENPGEQKSKASAISSLGTTLGSEVRGRNQHAFRWSLSLLFCCPAETPAHKSALMPFCLLF